MTALADIQQSISRLEQRKSELLKLKLEAVRKKLIICIKCHAQSKLFAWTFIQVNFYIYPHGCTGGDYWLNSETRQCFIICPKCKLKQYIYNHPQVHKIVSLVDKLGFDKKELFKEIEDK